MMRGERQRGRARPLTKDPQHGDPSVARTFTYCLDYLQESLPSHPCLLWWTDGLAVLDGRFICSALNVRAGGAQERRSGPLFPRLSDSLGKRSDDSKGGHQTGQTDHNAGRTRAPRLVPQGKLACGVTARASGHLRTCPTPADETQENERERQRERAQCPRSS
ncbi:hypothetical protein BO85DRAFT_463256 [Aspergillus piperis CBS 112811]|uniref:Uncharacterized protein n=1 Tax=Aspergillus piperis CBS 112811 TaxID=1448313 RepID=A0A8G1QSY9_9EURO|nr:hypothetical protein BO85DRAFT_463256 [Aspergillus piperis CBS 112811]RAH53293.1 hypothetical protein BO85DRAFT_463256 [Aspergillus piperis CBS 112811]